MFNYHAAFLQRLN